jgi:hypothetical protein
MQNIIPLNLTTFMATCLVDTGVLFFGFGDELDKKILNSKMKKQ